MKKLPAAIWRQRLLEAERADHRAKAELWRIVARIPRARARGHPGNWRRVAGFAMAAHKLREIIQIQLEMKKCQRFARGRT